ncbi:MAG: hypothetical protein HW419_3229 [Deltaproteobacteria bacterium]|nr:hypothetical protein [Deltaproteobacteria bacterium]
MTLFVDAFDMTREITSHGEDQLSAMRINCD